MANVFEQVKEAKKLSSTSNKCVILVVGSSRHTTLIVRGLKNDEDIKNNYVIVETELPSAYDSALDAARAWISKNCLRKLDGCDIKVVWVIDEGYPDHFIVHEILRAAFETHKKSVLTVIMDSNGKGLINEPSVFARTTAKSDNLSECARCCASAIKDMASLTITVEKITPHSERLRVWNSEKIILFGRTGSGKSTVAQMLTSGKISSMSKFKSGSSAIGVTTKIVREEGRGWHVTDTPGFGETKEGSISTDKATRKITKFIRNVCGVYSHFIYVFKWDRLS